MSDRSNIGVNRRRILKLLGATGLGTSAIQSAAGRGERSDPDRGGRPADPVAYEKLPPAARRHFDTALEAGRHTIRAAEAPESLNGVHYVRYQGNTYDVFSHSRYARVYHLNPSELSEVDDSQKQRAIGFEELDRTAREAFETAVSEGGYEGEGPLPDAFRTHDLVSYEGAVYEVRSVQGTAKESVMMPRTV